MVECYHFEHIINHLSFFFKDFYLRILKKGVGINFVYFLCEDFFFCTENCSHSLPVTPYLRRLQIQVWNMLLTNGCW